MGSTIRTMMLRRMLAGCLALPIALASGQTAAGPPTKTEAAAFLKTLEDAAAAGSPSPILALLAEDVEIKSTLRVGATERRFVHSKQELTTELPRLLTPATKPRASCRLLLLTPADDGPVALLKCQWALTLKRPEGDLRFEATGGLIVQRQAGRLLLTRANQMIQQPAPPRASAPDESRDNPRIWRMAVPKKTAKTPAAPAETPAPQTAPPPLPLPSP